MLFRSVRHDRRDDRADATGRRVAELRGRGPAARRGAGAEEGAAGRAAVLTRGAGAALVGLGGRWEVVAMAKTWSSWTVVLLFCVWHYLLPLQGRAYCTCRIL